MSSPTSCCAGFFASLLFEHMFNPLAHSIDKAVFLRALLKIMMPKANAKTPYKEPVNFDEEKFAADVEERSLLYDKGVEDYHRSDAVKAAWLELKKLHHFKLGKSFSSLRP